MRPPNHISLWMLTTILTLGFTTGPSLSAAGPSEATIEAAIKKGRDRLVELPGQPGDSDAPLAGYALLKCGTSPQHPFIQSMLQEAVKKVDSQVEPLHHVYEYACMANLFLEANPELYQPQLVKIRDWLVQRQQQNGSWFYPNNPNPEDGDSSITQFAILGLWAVQRGGVEVPNEVLEKAGDWWIKTQRPDGGFAYHPASFNSPLQTNSRLSMTAAGCGSVLILERMLYPNRVLGRAPSQPASRRRFGVLEQVPPETPALIPGKSRPPAESKLTPEILQKAAKKASGWLAGHYDATSPQWLTYCHYGCERAGALLETDKFGSHDWYAEGAEVLLRFQSASGEWQGMSDGTQTPRTSTAFALLFLKRATQSVIGPRPTVRLTGGGLLMGGRGLPENLSETAIQAGQVKTRKLLGPVDELLADLSKTDATEQAPSPEAIAATIQFDRPEDLLKQADQLPHLLKHHQPEVRQVAAWGLGRIGDVRSTPLLIATLKDADLDVAAEASLALCRLSRQWHGPLKGPLTDERIPAEPPIRPEGDLIEADLKAWEASVITWRQDATAAWKRWYLSVRPYDERDDRQTLKPQSP